MEVNVLFNDTLKTFYLRIYGIGHMETDHSDSERKLAVTTSLAARDLVYTTAFVTSVVEHRLERHCSIDPIHHTISR